MWPGYYSKPPPILQAISCQHYIILILGQSTTDGRDISLDKLRAVCHITHPLSKDLLMTSNLKTQNTAVGIVFLVVVIDLIGFGIVLPLLPLYAKHYGASPLIIGLLAISYSATQFIFSPILGRMSDRRGRRPILLLSLVGAVIFYALFGWAPSLLWLFVARLGAGVFAANISTAMAYIADMTSRENRAKGMGLIGAAFGIGFIIGPAVGGFLSQYSYNLPGYGAAVLSFCALTLAFFKLPESLSTRATSSTASIFRAFWQPIQTALRQKDFVRPMLMYFLVTFAFANMQLTFPLFTQAVFNLDVKHVGYLFALSGVMSILLQGGLIGRLSQKFGEGVLALTGSAIYVVGLLALPFAKSVYLLVVIMGLFGLATGLTLPTLTSLLSLSADEENQGSVLGVSRSVGTLARILGPLWGGWCYGALGLNWPFWTAGIVSFAAIIFGWSLRTIKPVSASKIKLPAEIAG
jgi:DHA1 family tetracycline resistance protein-like MFS transporter